MQGINGWLKLYAYEMFLFWNTLVFKLKPILKELLTVLIDDLCLAEAVGTLLQIWPGCNYLKEYFV